MARRPRIKLKIKKIDPFKIPGGKCPVRQRTGGGPHTNKGKKRETRAERKNPRQQEAE